MSKRKKVGLSPGTLIYTGETKSQEPVLSCITYNSREMSSIPRSQIEQYDYREGNYYWIDLRGIHKVELISSIGEKFKIHKLILEDILDPGQRIKIEDFDSSMFAILYNLNYDKVQKTLRKEQISIYLTKQYLITFQEDPDDTLEGIRERMNMVNSRIRSRGTDYLFYAVLDFIVDRYFIILDNLHDEIERIEDQVVQKDEQINLEELHHLRNKIISFQRYVQPLREELSQIKDLETNLIDASTLLFIRDLQDNIRHILESLENQRELLNGIRELQISRANLNMNKDMRWLAVVSTIAIPIIFFTGVYGMNFEYMPEIKWRYGYPAWWAGILVVGLTIFTYLKRKKFF